MTARRLWTGTARLAATLAGVAAVLAAGWGVILLTAGVHVILTGFILLLGGYLSLGALALGADWIWRGFTGHVPGGDRKETRPGVTRAPPPRR